MNAKSNHPGRASFRSSGHCFQEEQLIIKDWGGRLPIALVYPNKYFLGMSNLGVHTLYRTLNDRPDTVCERVFTDTTDRGWPVSIESNRPLTDFAVIAFSISYELDYFAIPSILRAAKIPVYSAERDEKQPLIIAGGPCITGNPMPIAAMFDAFAIGESEAILPELIPVLQDGISDHRDALLSSISTLPGMFVPGKPKQQPIARRYAENLNLFDTTTCVLTRDTELGELYLVEAERGCQRGCRFCLVNGIYSPMRFRKAERVLASAREGLRHRKRIGLVGPAVTDHPEISVILDGLIEMGAEISISSLRISSLSGEIIKGLSRGGAKNITIAPEAGSQRLRDLINKGISEDDIAKTAENIAAARFRQVKMYFIAGLPFETDTDIEEIFRLVLNFKGTIDPSGARLTINVSPFVPKAGTPFQWLPMAQRDNLDSRISFLSNCLRSEGVSFNAESPAWSEIQAALSRGDERLTDAIVEVGKVTPPRWHQVTEKHGIDLNYYVNERWTTETRLPWAHIDAGPRYELLCSQLEKATALEHVRF